MLKRLILTCILFSYPLLAQEVKLPDPMNLAPSWFSYFGQDRENFEEAQQVFYDYLNEIESELEAGQQRERVERLSSRIRLNIRALNEARLAEEAGLPVQALISEQYHLGELLTLEEKRRAAEARLRGIENDIETVSRAIESGEERLDRLRTSYEATEEASEQRLSIGLERIADRLSLELTRERMRLDRASLKATGAEVQELEKELAAVKVRLVEDDSLGFEYERRLTESKAAVSEAEERLLQLEASLLTSTADDALSKAQQGHLRQRVLLSRVDLALATGSSLRWRLLVDLNRYLGDSSEAEEATWSDELQKSEQEAEELTADLEEWLWLTEREQERVNEELTRFNGENGDEGVQAVYETRLATAQETLALLREFEGQIADLEILTSLVQGEILEQSSTVTAVLFYAWDLFRDGWGAAMKRAQKGLFRIGDVPVTAFGIFYALVIIIAGFWFSRFAQRAFEAMGEGHRRSAAQNFYVFGRLAHYLIISASIVLALASLGLDFSNLAIVAGALSVGIGFGLQTIVSNFFSGLIILFEGNLKVGDFLELETGPRGRITAINVRSTIIRTNDGIEIVIPNAEIIGNRVINWTMSDVNRRMHIPFGVAYGSDKELVIQAALEAADRVDCTIKGHSRYADPKVNLLELGDSSLNFELVVWVDRKASKRHRGTVSRYLMEIHNSLEQYKIEIPFPQRDVHIIERKKQKK